MGSYGGIGGAGDPNASITSGLSDSNGGDSRAANSFSEAMDGASHSASSESPDNQPNNENGDGIEIITVADNRRVNKRVPSDRFDDLKDIREQDRARESRRGGRARVRDWSEQSWQREQERVRDQIQFADDTADRLIREQEMREQELQAQQADELDAGIRDAGAKEPADR